LFWFFFSQYFCFFFRLFIYCRSTEHDHIKDNLSAKLPRIQTFGKMKLEEFKDLNSPAYHETCEAKMVKNPIWYPLTLDVFVKFLYKIISPSLCLCLSPFNCCHSFTLIFVCVRENCRTQPTLQQGCIGRIHPSRSDLLPKFGILSPKPKINSSRVFGLEISKRSFPSPTRIMVNISSTRCTSSRVVYCVVTEANLNNLGITSCHHDTYPSRHYAG
jgi:hypothetical protein